MQFKKEFSASKKFNFLPIGQLSRVNLRIEPKDAEAATTLYSAFTGILDSFTLLPVGWNHFEVLRDHHIQTTNLTGRGLQNGKETVMSIEGELPNDEPNDPELPTLPVFARIYTTFARTPRIGEIEYVWHAELSEHFSSSKDFPTMISILKHRDLKLTSCNFGITRYRRLNFGLIVNPFPISIGELNLNLTPFSLSLTGSYLRLRELPELSSVAQNLAKLKVGNELLDHLAESH